MVAFQFGRLGRLFGRGPRASGRPTRPGHRARGREASPEPLEPRLCLSADAGPASATHLLDWQGSLVEAHIDRWIVRAASPKVDAPVFDAGLPPAGGGAAWSGTSLGEGFWSLVTPGAAAGEVLDWATGSPWVDYVEPDFAFSTAATPDDPSFMQLWGLHNTGQSGGVADADIDALEAWDITTGSRDVVIAVIDTGVDYTHPDLAANMWTNPGEIPGDGLDNDGNGFVDDVYGWDFANNDSNPMDDNEHGTHVAGTIGAVGGNARGVAGVNWQVSIMALKFLTGGGSGSTSDAVAAINYATRMRRDFGINIVATNNSWGGGGASTSLRQAIEAGGAAGILFVAAAGNESNDNDASPSYPASYTSEAVLSVAASDRSNRMAGFSNFGARSVDLAAPGVSIYSTTPGNRYASFSGTSMAAPHVAGVVGLLAAADPTASAADIRAAILNTTTPVAAFAGRTATGGLLNAAAALEEFGGTSPLRASIEGVWPDPRYDAVESIVIDFNRPAVGFDLGDLVLTRDGAVVPLAGTTLTPDHTGEKWTLSGLGVLTADVGTYVLTLGAGTSGIVDGADIPLASDASDTWRVIDTPPGEPNDSIADAVSIALVGGSADVAGMIGDGVNGPADVDLLAVDLFAGSILSIDVAARDLPTPSLLDSFVRVFDASGAMIDSNDDADGSLDSRLVLTVPATGTYFVGISSFGNSGYDPHVDGSGSPGFTQGEYLVTLEAVLPPLSVDIVDVSPDPRFQAVESIVIGFNRPMTGFDITDLVLTRDGEVVPLDAATLAPVDDVTWSLGGLSGLTGGYGTYELSLVAEGSGIVDTLLNPLESSAFDTWMVLQPKTVPDAGDSVQRAFKLPKGEVVRSGVRIVGGIGDGRYGERDVDLYRIVLTRGQRLIVDVDAADLPSKSPLDSYLRVFDAKGRQISFNDDFNGSADSLVAFTASARKGTYYVGVSGFGNASYKAKRAGSGAAGSTGAYEISFEISSASRIGQTVTTMGFRDGAAPRGGLQAAFAAMGGDWLALQQGWRPQDSSQSAADGGTAAKRWIMRWR
jgi:hypothetical protein